MIRTVSAVAAAAILATVAGAAQAAVFKDDGCQVTVPDSWKITKQRAVGPGQNNWAETMKGDSVAQIVAIEKNLGATKVSEDAHVIIMVSSASAAGMTNKQFHGISKTTPSCVADVTTPAGAGEAAAKAMAMTSRPQG